MANVIFHRPATIEEQLLLMTQDARFDIEDPQEAMLAIADIHARPGAAKVPKVFISNQCSFNCSYCGCRASNEEKHRYCCEPKKMAQTAVDEAVKNKRGVFVTSAIYKNADYTQQLIIQTIKSMREDLGYTGYIHAKVMPGADPLLIQKTGQYASRLSVNIEVAQSSGYSFIAKQKNKNNILAPMEHISRMISAAKREKAGANFAFSQTTQLMAGSTGEDDRTIITLSKALYHKYHLQRVYYTAFQYQHPAQGYTLPLVSTPIWRVRRLYQADRLLHLYGFSPDEITPAEQPNLEEDLDPKISWALRNLHLFPVEVNKADYEMLLRVPGIGEVAAKRMLRARKFGPLSHECLKKMGVSLKRSVYFITCNGKYYGGAAFDNDILLRKLLTDNGKNTMEQTSLFSL